ncbi:MAG: 3-phosphoshikimate 1-carboxyvinyltransferase, partial [Clostridia bacterium]|nr:3-phosphoshikimate 1-carboxyvinyltransferase [Clostridia bacterium]
MRVRIEPSIAKGVIKAPPSKSYAHRYLIASALAKGISEVDGIIPSDDMEATLKCISALGVSINQQNQKVTLKNTNLKKQEADFYCNESGSTLRFFIPIALALGGINNFHGTERLISRGISVYEEICNEQSIKIEKTKEKITFIGKLKPGTFNVRGDISSQFITGLLFALPLLNGDSVINITTNLESTGYIDITLDVLKQFGIQIDKNGNSFYIRGNQNYISQNVTVEGDMSNGAFLDAFNILKGDVSVIGLKNDSLQNDSAYKIMFENLKKSFCTCDISNCIDLGPILFAVASVCNGGKFIGTKRLRIKESDRVEAM